jgi:NAD-dependent dihydropyrimidine dehydrogenase PreA subunit
VSAYSFDNSDCERCFDCVTACPRGVLEEGDPYPVVAHPEECMGCGVCLGVCRRSLGLILGPYIAAIMGQPCAMQKAVA